MTIDFFFSKNLQMQSEKCKLQNGEIGAGSHKNGSLGIEEWWEISGNSILDFRFPGICGNLWKSVEIYKNSLKY